MSHGSIPPPRAPRPRLTAPGEIDHHVADMTATASGDVTLGQYQARLAESGQWFPIDGDTNAPLATLVETNSTGPLRLGYGAWRDLLLGAQFENGKGDLVTAGGRTVKNVAGYDLTKFMIGQTGVFGRIATLTTRTYKRPEATLLATFARSHTTLGRLLPSDCRPQWAILTADALLCGYVGDARSIDFYEHSLREHRPTVVSRRSLDDDVAHRASLWRASGEISYRASVPPSRVLDFAQSASLSNWAADAAFGIVVGSCRERDTKIIREHAADVGGTVVYRRADGSLFNVVTNPIEQRLIERLKGAFDPNNALAPLPQQSAVN